MYLQIRSVPLFVIAGFALAQTPTPAKVAIINAQKAVADTQEIQKDQAVFEANTGHASRCASRICSASFKNYLSNRRLRLTWRPPAKAELQATFTQKNKSNCNALGKIYKVT